MSTFTQRSFAAGEISPKLYPRVDVSRYQTGAKTVRNTIINKSGGSSNRPGLEYIDETLRGDLAVRMIPFIFSSDQTYMLEFGHEYYRVLYNGAVLLESTTYTVDSVTKANPAIVSLSPDFSKEDGHPVYLAGIADGGMTQIPDGYYTLTTQTLSDQFELADVNGTAINSTGYSTYTAGGTAQFIVGGPTTYQSTELFDIQFTQSGNVLTIVHPSHPVREITRNAHDDWSIAEAQFNNQVSGPSVTVTPFSAGGTTYRYIVTGVDKDTQQESGPGVGATKTVTAFNSSTAGSLLLTTSAAHGYVAGDTVYIDLVFDNGEVRYGYKTVTSAPTTTTFRVAASVSNLKYATLVSGTVYARYALTTAAKTRPNISETDYITLTWTHNSQFVEYNVYLEQYGVFGYLGIARPLDNSTTVTFVDIGTDPNLVDTLPDSREVFDGADDYPAVVALFQQRRYFGRSNNSIEDVWASKVGAYSIFSYHLPLADDDSFNITLASRTVSEIRHIVDADGCLVFTNTGEWVFQGSAAGLVIPSEINAKQIGYYGANKLPPIVVGKSCLYVQARGSVVRDLGFNYQIDGYTGNDLTNFSDHLFEGYEFVSWAFQLAPNSILWMVRDDGKLLSCTFIKEQEIIAWAVHDTDGIVEDVAVVPEGNEDALYIVVKRTINGVAKRYIERLESRYVDDTNIIDKAFMDSSLTYDGRNTGSTTMTISGGTTWDAHETMTVTASASYFLTSDVGNEIHFTDSTGAVLFRFSIAARSSATVVTGTVDRLVPVASRSAATTSWTKAVDQVTGLSHLEGEEVSVFADGYVVASPNNPAYGTPISVASGVLTLSECYGVIHVGLPYISDIETLDIDSAQGETLADKQKFVGKVTLHLEKSRGIWVGAKAPSDDTVDALENLTEAKLRDLEGYNEPNSLMTGKLGVAIRPEWNSNGRVFIRQVDPLPISVLAVSPAGLFPISGGG